MRYEEVKKRLWKEGIIVVFVMTLLGGGTYYLTTVFDDADKNKQQLETQVNSIVATMNTLRDKFSLVQKNANLYQEVLRKSADDGLNVSSDLLREKLKKVNSTYHLSGNSTNMDVPQEMSGADYKHGDTAVVSSNIKSHFFALTDEDVYSLLPALQQELTGTLKFTRVSLARKDDLTEAVLQNIRKNGQAQLVDTNVEFLWLGIKIAPPSAAKNAGPNGIKNIPQPMMQRTP